MKNTWKSLILGTVLTSMTACSGSGGGNATDGGSTTPAKTVTFSGKIAGVPSVMSLDESIMAGLTDNYVSCMVMGSVPPIASTVELGSGGVFSLSLSVSAGDAVGCFLRRSSVAAGFIPLVFQEADSMAGGKTTQRGLSPRSDSTSVSLGNISIVTINNEIVAKSDSAPVEDGKAEAPAFADISGSWIIKKVYEDAVNGYVHPCETEDEMTAAQMASCKANEWNTIFMHSFRAKKASETRWGFGLWKNESAYNNCGKSEGVTLDTGWSVDTTSMDHATLKDAFAVPTLDLTDISTYAAKAPFRKWVSTSGGGNNCPYQDADSPSCATATTCAELDYDDGIHTPEEQSAEKVRCVLNRMGSGGNNSYNWDGICGRRLSKSVWDKIPYEASNYTATGCKTANCSGTDNSVAKAGLEATDWEASPLFRFMNSEMIVDGNIGTATGSEVDQQTTNINSTTYNCWMNRTTKMTIIQKSASNISVLVEQTVTPSQLSGKWNNECLQETGIAEQLANGMKLKLDLVK